MVVEELQGKKQNRIHSLTSENVNSKVHLYNHSNNGLQIPVISVIMPAFNEEKAVGVLIDRILNVLKQITNNFEIIVIDDGSKDQTLDICREKRVITIHNRYNCGKGYALREGFKLARGDIILTIDSDGEHHPEEIPLIIQPILEGKVEAVFGTRFAQKHKIPITTVVNSFGNKFFNFLIRRLTNRKFTDTQCGFRAFKKACLSKLTLESFGYEIETEMIVKLAQQNIPFCEIPVSSRITYFRKSNINRFLDGFRILLTIFKTRIKNP